MLAGMRHDRRQPCDEWTEAVPGGEPMENRLFEAQLCARGALRVLQESLAWRLAAMPAEGRGVSRFSTKANRVKEGTLLAIGNSPTRRP